MSVLLPGLCSVNHTPRLTKQTDYFGSQLFVLRPLRSDIEVIGLGRAAGKARRLPLLYQVFFLFFSSEASQQAVDQTN